MISFESEPFGDGIRITRVSSTDADISIPGSIGGSAVRSIGPRFMKGCPSVRGRTIRIPGTVTDIDPLAFDDAIGISVIEFDGDLSDFNVFGIVSPSECTLRCRESGSPFEFAFPGGTPMSFPGFDEAMLSSVFSIPLETAMSRLSRPALLTDSARDGYRRAVSGRIMPRAEQAVSSGDRNGLEELLSTGMLDLGSLKVLLERSARSGKVSMTSVIMSMIGRTVSKRSRSACDAPSEIEGLVQGGASRDAAFAADPPDQDASRVLQSEEPEGHAVLHQDGIEQIGELGGSDQHDRHAAYAETVAHRSMEAVHGLLELRAYPVEVHGGCQNESVRRTQRIVYPGHAVPADAASVRAAGATLAADARGDIHIRHSEDDRIRACEFRPFDERIDQHVGVASSPGASVQDDYPAHEDASVMPYPPAVNASHAVFRSDVLTRM